MLNAPTQAHSTIVTESRALEAKKSRMALYIGVSTPALRNKAKVTNNITQRNVTQHWKTINTEVVGAETR